jgi:hypothetical protein
MALSNRGEKLFRYGIITNSSKGIGGFGTSSKKTCLAGLVGSGKCYSLPTGANIIGVFQSCKCFYEIIFRIFRISCNCLFVNL